MEFLARQAPEHYPGLILKVKASYELLIGCDLAQEKSQQQQSDRIQQADKRDLKAHTAVQMKVYSETDLA